MVFDSTFIFSNISIISRWSVLLEVETIDLSQVTDKLHLYNSCFDDICS